MMFPVPFVRAVLVGAECGRRRAQFLMPIRAVGEGRKKNKSIFNNKMKGMKCGKRNGGKRKGSMQKRREGAAAWEGE